MALFVEWDVSTSQAIRIINDDWTGKDPAQRAPGILGVDVSADSERKIYPLVIDYPENYHPRFNVLLGPSVFVLEGDTVHQKFLNPDFSTAGVRGALLKEIEHQERHALSVTNHHILESFEFNRRISDDIARQRGRIRAYADLLRSKLHDCSPSELLDFDSTVRADVGSVELPTLVPAEFVEHTKRKAP